MNRSKTKLQKCRFCQFNAQTQAYSYKSDSIVPICWYCKHNRTEYLNRPKDVLKR